MRIYFCIELEQRQGQNYLLGNKLQLFTISENGWLLEPLCLLIFNDPDQEQKPQDSTTREPNWQAAQVKDLSEIEECVLKQHLVGSVK